jgi:hypothetical protein
VELANTTPLAARLDVGVLHTRQGEVRVATLLAKATLRANEQGHLALDTQLPEPILLADEAHPLGIVPRDDLPAGKPSDEGDAFEVAVLARAHAPGGTPAPRMSVAIGIGGRRLALEVTGDRVWKGTGEGAKQSVPSPFVTMPLSLSRAFGGAIDVEIDEDSFVPVVDARNPQGRGFDPEPQISGLAEKLKCPAPYPRYPTTRSLPNVEHPSRLITSWSDAPDPAGWSPWPISSPHCVAHGRVDPELLFDEEPTERKIVLEGLTRDGTTTLEVPDLAPSVDLSMDEKRATVLLRATRWVIRVDERVVTVTYRYRFTLRGWQEGQPRSARLRLT